MSKKPFYTQKKWQILFVLALGFIAGFWVSESNLLQDKPIDHFRVERLYSKGNHLINPIMQIEGPPGGDKRLESAKKKIDSYIEKCVKDKEIWKASVYLRDLNQGIWVGINEDEKYTAASLAKVPILFTFFVKAQKDPLILSKKIKYEVPLHLAWTQNVAPRNTLQIGNEYTVEELIENMTAFSDNLSMYLLANNNDIDDALVDQLFTDLHLPVPAKRSDYNISAKDYARYFRLLYSATYLNKDSSEKALKMLTATDFKEGLVAGVPEGVAIAHKFGERGEGLAGQQLHDCGIVYYPNNPYLLCVMTKGWNLGTLKNIIKNISHITYEHMSTKPAS